VMMAPTQAVAVKFLTGRQIRNAQESEWKRPGLISFHVCSFLFSNSKCSKLSSSSGENVY
jgi:hypothetical protein